jgi:hypothetical protein
MRLATAGLAEGEAEAEARLGAAGLVVARLVVVIPAVHAASDRLAAQAARAAADERYLFIVFRPGSYPSAPTGYPTRSATLF